MSRRSKIHPDAGTVRQEGPPSALLADPPRRGARASARLRSPRAPDRGSPPVAPATARPQLVGAGPHDAVTARTDTASRTASEGADRPLAARRRCDRAQGLRSRRVGRLETRCPQDRSGLEEAARRRRWNRLHRRVRTDRCVHAGLGRRPRPPGAARRTGREFHSRRWLRRTSGLPGGPRRRAGSESRRFATRTAIVTGEPLLAQRAAAVEAVARDGRRHWKKTAGYHQQARAENTFGRFKRTIGRSLRARSEEGQSMEVSVGCLVLGLPDSVPVPAA